jgi:hypothetical protein
MSGARWGRLARMNVVLAIIALVLAVPTWVTLRSDAAIFTDYEDIPRLFPGFTRDTIRGLTVSIPRRDVEGRLVRDEAGAVVRDTLPLARADQDWQIAGQGPLAGVTVRSTRVYERVLQHIESMRRDEEALVQLDAGPDELASYGLGEDEAILVQCFDREAPVVQLLVGVDASRGRAGDGVVRGFFVRSRDSSDVVLYEQDYWVLDVDPAQWYERAPLRVPVDEVVEVSIRNLKGDVTFVRKDPASADWSAAVAPPDTGAVRDGEVRAFVESLSLLNIQEYAERLPADPAERDAVLRQRGLEAPEFRAELVLANGQRHAIGIGGTVGGRNERYLTISSVDFVMTVGEWIVARFEKDPAAVFFDPPSTRVGPGGGR